MNNENLKELLTDLLEYMEDKADVQGDSEHLKPNEEMRFQVRIEEMLEQLTPTTKMKTTQSLEKNNNDLWDYNIPRFV